nr:integrase, catalytic region, zinc finger, CCHC-type, peptidase aspartic, catalytic [Tanacetum cinerariifolium]GFA32338.1 integrase, catalytic region, zinc finger, CCHC-type, peptidase aspartic, catalytic [Tanacetum cinerariifolium]
MGTVRFGNDHVAAILGFGDLQWGNILITRVYFVKGLGHNLFSVGQFCDSDLEVAFRRNVCFVKNLEGADLLKGDRSTNLYTINLHEMASALPICLMARASSTKSWLWHQRLSHLNFDTINDLARNDLVVGLLKFKYHKEHLCPSCEQRKSKRASHPSKPVPNSRQRLHLLHMDLCGPMRITSINGKRAEAIATACFTQNRSIIHRRFNKMPYELINGRKPDILFLYVFGALCYPKNDREDIGKLGAKGDIGFFIGYSADSCAYRVYNHWTKKIMETMNDVEELNPNAMVDGNTFVNPFANSSISATASSSHQNVDPSNMHTSYQAYPHEFQWTKDHPLEQNKHDEQQTVIKNKSRLVVRGYRQEEGIDFEESFASQAPRAWYDELSKFLLQNHFFKGTIDPTLFIRRFQNDILVAKPTEKHLKEVKRIFCYLRGTVNTSLWYMKDYGFELTGFSDADYAGCKDTFKSTSGGAQFLGENLVSWSSKKQDCTALSTAEAKYVPLSACCAQVLWMRT